MPDSASEDADAAWTWVLSQGATLGLDTTRIALWGCSVGAALATELTMRLKTKNSVVQPKLVVLDRQALPFNHLFTKDSEVLTTESQNSPCLDDRTKYPEQQPGFPLEPYYVRPTQHLSFNITYV